MQLKIFLRSLSCLLLLAACQQNKVENLRIFPGGKADPSEPPLLVEKKRDQIEKWQFIQTEFQKILDKEYIFDSKKVQIPGASLAIVVDGKMQFAAGFGQRSLEDDRPVTAETVMTVGSLSKMITGLTALTLADQRQIDMDLPINSYLKKQGYQLLRLADDQEAADQISIRQSLLHTAGLPDDLPSGIDEYGPSVCKTGSDAYSSYFHLHRNSPLWTTPGDVWSYSNANFFLAAAALEGATDQSFEDLATKQVLEKARMIHANWDGQTIEANDNFAKGYDYWSPLGTKTQLSAFGPSSTPCRIFRPAAGLHASVLDYAALAETLMAKDRSLLSPESLDAFMSGQVPTYDDDWDYSYGIFVLDGYKGKKLVGHDGVSWGYSTIFLMVPEHHFAVVAFVQAGKTFSPDLWSFALQTIDLFLQLPRGPRQPKKAVPSELPGFEGTYRGWTFDYENYSEANPAYAALTVDIFLDPAKENLQWEDDWLGQAELKPLWWPKFRVSYPESYNDINISFARDATGQAHYMVSREFIGKRID